MQYKVLICSSYLANCFCKFCSYGGVSFPLRHGFVECIAPEKTKAILWLPLMTRFALLRACQKETFILACFLSPRWDHQPFVPCTFSQAVWKHSVFLLNLCLFQALRWSLDFSETVVCHKRVAFWFEHRTGNHNLSLFQQKNVMFTCW